ncbi:hypothetical protein Tco_0238594 [Tanacetum coccineum]
MKRVGKGFSGRETPLFLTMVVHNQEEMGEGSTMPIDPHHTPIITQPSSSQHQKKQKSTRPKKKDTEEDSSKQWRKIDDIDKDAEITLVDETRVRHDDIMFDVSDLAALAELKSIKPKVTNATTVTTIGILLQEPSESITTTTTTIIIPSKDKGKGIMVEEPLKMKKKDQISFDEQEAIRLQAKFDEEVRLAREKDKANVALIEEWNDIQANINADYQLAQRLQAREQEELTIEERAKLFQQLLEKRRKHFAAKGAKEKRNIPPTKAQQRSIMCTYLKNIEGWKLKDLKNKSFDSIQNLFDKAMKRVNTFVDMDTELVKES